MKNLIENDPLVAAIMEATAKLDAKPEAKLKALIRCGKIAEAYSGYACDWDAARATFAGSELTQEEPKIRIYPDRRVNQLKVSQANTHHAQAS